MSRQYLLVALASLALGACADYPDDFAPVDRGMFSAPSGRCADIRGTYRLHGPETHRNRGGFSATFLREVIAEPNARWPWEQVTIAGNANDSLIVTVSRSDSAVAAYRAFAFEHGDYGQRQWSTLQNPEVRWRGSFAAMSDDAYAENLDKLTIRRDKRRVLRRGVDYDCGGGWVRSARTVHDPGPFRDRPRPDTVNGEVLLARSDDGGLVAEAIFKEAVTFSVWCGDGCRGAPIGMWTMHRWARWPKGEPFVRTPDPRPWAVPQPVATVVRDDAPSYSVEDLESRVRALALSSALKITDLRADGRVMQVDVSGSARSAISQFLRSLNDDAALASPELVAIRTTAADVQVATVRVRGR